MSERAGYYDRPVLKEPVWIWAVPVYFYLGGAAGAAAALGAMAQIADDAGLRRLVSRCRWIAATGTGVGAALLVYDLGRPERFLNMLRVWRPTSVLNMGSWILASASGLSAGAALAESSKGSMRVAGDASGLAAGLVGLPLSGYTAVLLSDTAIPLWRATRKSLPALFVASGVSSAASLLEMAALDSDESEIVHRLGLIGKLAELAATVRVERDADSVERVGLALRQGRASALWKAAKVATAASLVTSLVPGRARGRRFLSGFLGTLGALALRFAVFHAGKASARDPQATFEQQRAGK